MGRSMSHSPRPPPFWASLPLPPTLLREHACYKYAVSPRADSLAQCANCQDRCFAVALLLHALFSCDAMNLYMCVRHCLPALIQFPGQGYRCTACARLLRCVRNSAPNLKLQRASKTKSQTATPDVLIHILVLQIWACRPWSHACRFCLLHHLDVAQPSLLQVHCACQLLLSSLADGFQHAFRQAATLSACSSPEVLRRGVLLAELGILPLMLPCQLPLHPL